MDVAQMTDEQIDEMESGTTTDNAVALAIGKDAYSDWLRSVLGVSHRAFYPSSDWNDAMFAAERFGLFNPQSKHHSHLTIAADKQQWEISYCVGGWEFDGTTASAPTGPLAICRAILKLARDE